VVDRVIAPAALGDGVRVARARAVGAGVALHYHRAAVRHVYDREAHVRVGVRLGEQLHADVGRAEGAEVRIACGTRDRVVARAQVPRAAGAAGARLGRGQVEHLEALGGTVQRAV